MPSTSLATAFDSSPSARFSDTYTRLVVSSILPADGDGGAGPVGVLPYQPRGALARFLAGSTHSVNMTAKVTVGAFTATVPLATIGHASNAAEGEAFTRTVYHQAENFPLFLVKRDGSNAIVSVQFSLKASTQYQGSAAALIQTAQSVIQAVVPQSAVLTTLTQQSTKDVASAIDNTLAKLLAMSIDEEPWVDNDIRRWGGGVSATFSIPAIEGAWDRVDDYRTVGTWTVRFADPRPSIFSDIEVCERSFTLRGESCALTLADAIQRAQQASLDRPEEVLGFQLVNGAQALGTVAAFLKQQDFWTSAQKAFQGAGSPKPDDISLFCRSIRNAITGLNLNSIDAGIVTVAVQHSAAFSSAVTKAMADDPADCGFAR